MTDENNRQLELSLRRSLIARDSGLVRRGLQLCDHITQRTLARLPTPGLLSLRGHFQHPHLVNEGMLRRLGRGRLHSIRPVESRLAVAASYAGVSLIDLSTGEALWDIDSPGNCADVSINASTLAIGTDSEIILWDLNQAPLARTIPLPEAEETKADGVFYLALTPGFTGLISAGIAGVFLDDRYTFHSQADLWEFRAAKWIRRYGPVPGHPIPLTLGPNGRLLAALSQSGTLVLWETESGKVALEVNNCCPPYLALSAGGHVSFRGQTGEYLWHLSEANVLTRTLSPWSPPVGPRAFSPDSSVLAYVESHGDPDNERVVVRSLPRMETRCATTAPLTRSVDVAFSSDGAVLGAASANGRISLFDATTGAILGSAATHSSSVSGVDFSPDSSRVATCGYGFAQIWDVASGRLVRHDRFNPVALLCIAFSPTGRFLAAGGCRGQIHVWEADTGRRVPGFGGHKPPALFTKGEKDPDKVFRLAISPDDRYLATASQDNGLRIWGLEDGSLLATHSVHDLADIAFSRSGEWLVAGPRYGIVIALRYPFDKTSGAFEVGWDGANPVVFDDFLYFDRDLRDAVHRALPCQASCQFAVGGHWLYDTTGLMVTTEVYSPDLQYLATAELEGARVYRPPSRSPLLTITQHTLGVAGLAISPDSKLLATASPDGTARLWSLKALA